MTRDTSTGLKWEELCKAEIGNNEINLTKYKLYSYLKDKNIDWKTLLSKKLLPDEAYFDGEELKVFEKKYQKVAGSVDEKLQTCAFKIGQYQKIGKAIGAKKVSYTYLLNDWFSKPEYKDVLEYINSVEGCSYKIIKGGI